MARAILSNSFSTLLLTAALFSGAACSRSTLLGVDTSFDTGGSAGTAGTAGTAGSGASGGTGAGGTGPTGPGGTGGTGASTTSTGTGTSTVICETDQDCEDGDICTTDTCENELCVSVPRDDDQDGFGPLACGGLDCNDFNPQVNPGKAEVCTDAADNNCNGVADCFDPACENAPTCGCTPSPGGENCSNNKDDDCDEIVDCFDSECAGTPECGCAASEAGKCENGFDDNCNGKIDCDDSQCFSDPKCQCQVVGELCGDGQDNDCDLLVDCADPNCQGVFPCACVPPGVPEQCGDGQDNDCDNLVDCADAECLVSPLCQNCSMEICDDGIDNSCDGKIDCADAGCIFAPNCPTGPEICNNGLDDDKDGKIDCQDPSCANNPFCVTQQANCLSPKLIPGSGTYTGDTTGNVSETKGVCGGDAGEAVFYFTLIDPSYVLLDSIGTTFDSTLYVRTGACNSGKEIGCDDDSAGVQWSAKLEFTILYPGTYYVFLDGFTVDPQGGANEGPFTLNVVITPNPTEICNDGKDNDGDIYSDCADSDCWTTAPCDTCFNGSHGVPEFGVAACTDGVDNDCDGTNDCQDEDCSASDYYITECCDGADENGNGIVDDFNCKCASDADCQFGQICYTHTAHACGPPCDAFFGQICPFVAAGSACSMVTQQCEF
ncbi:MAG: putative metal-binding motif-containing protein [Polyangiaceae bacterium]|nr:putative metal-binding motif-containing protein [Polyangiaceae bacterium]